MHYVFSDQTADEEEIQAKPLKCEIKTMDKADKLMWTGMKYVRLRPKKKIQDRKLSEKKKSDTHHLGKNGIAYKLYRTSN